MRQKMRECIMLPEFKNQKVGEWGVAFDRTFTLGIEKGFPFKNIIKDIEQKKLNVKVQQHTLRLEIPTKSLEI